MYDTAISSQILTQTCICLVTGPLGLTDPDKVRPLVYSVLHRINCVAALDSGPSGESRSRLGSLEAVAPNQPLLKLLYTGAREHAS